MMHKFSGIYVSCYSEVILILVLLGQLNKVQSHA